MSPRPLGDDEVRRELSRLSGWTGDRHRIRRTVTLPPDRVRVLLDHVDEAQRELNHHAQIDERPDGVHFTVWTHTVDAVTDYDLALAGRIDEAVDAVGSAG